LRLSDGRRTSSCAARIPANAAGEMAIESPGGPLRAVAYAGADRALVLSGRVQGAKPAALLEGQAAPLASGFDRAISLAQSALVHVRASAGVCALVGSDGSRVVDGEGRGCELHRLLEKGTYRLAIRPFGDQPLAGTAAWTKSAVEVLTEGVGPERWIAPGEALYFRFTTASTGRVGIGLQVQADALECAVIARRRGHRRRLQQLLT
jgi:hypothetical protein